MTPDPAQVANDIRLLDEIAARYPKAKRAGLGVDYYTDAVKKALLTRLVESVSAAPDLDAAVRSITHGGTA